jgi:Alr-MurF fusion protein
MILFSTIARITGGKIIQLIHDSSIDFLLTDSRKIIFPSKSLFFAIQGERHNGHAFILDAYKAGIRQFVVEYFETSWKTLVDANFIEVKSSVNALQETAIYKRNKFEIPVIGITGSNGKTIIKEWLAQLLASKFAVVKSPKSYNSQIGVPLSVWQMNDFHTAGIFEAGISKPHEMVRLEKIIQPTIGIFTNIGSAHDDGFSSKAEKIAEKMSLFKHSAYVFYCKDHLLIDQAVQKDKLKSITWSQKNVEADICFSIHSQQENVCTITSKLTERVIHFTINLPFSDKASLENLFHCIAVMLFFNFDAEEISKKIKLLRNISMRLELKQGLHQCYLIDDTYNNDLAGLTIALDFLQQQNQKEQKTLILSDLYETGIEKKLLYQQISTLVSDKGIQRFIGIGKDLVQFKEFFKSNSLFFESTAQFLRDLPQILFQNELVLLKGSRIFAFESIVKQLQQKAHRTVLEINLDALAHNLNFYRSLLKPSTKIMVMVKSFAYGSGSLEVAQLLQFHRVDYLTVAYTDEGVLLRENGIYLPIMVMNPAEDTFDLLVQHRLEPVIYSEKIFQSLLLYLENKSVELKIHIEIETGMHRLGVSLSDLKEILTILKKSKKITLTSLFSHLAGADDAQFENYTLNQYQILLKAVELVEQNLNHKPLVHLLNSAGIVRYPQFQLDMVRLGVGLYGVEANGMYQNALETVGTLKTTISQIKYLESGETVGYSRKGKTDKKTKIGIIAIGYGDGYNRLYSNGVGKVWVNGKLAPVIGNVCMDMCMLNLTEIEAEEGDEVIIFGKEISILDLAKSIQTIPYEILTNVSERVKRVFYAG